MMGQFTDDIIRNKFTAWMKIVVNRARIDYMRQVKKRPREESIYDDNLSYKLTYEQNISISDNEFDFENRDLASVFAKLPHKRRQILILLYVSNMSPEEIASELNCSIQYVYNQRSIALKELRKNIKREGD